MHSSHKLATKISVTFIIILIVTAILSISSSHWKNLFISLLAITCIIFVFIIELFFKRKELILPPNFTLVTILFIFFAQFFGEIIGFYSLFWWWDLLLHFIAGIYFFIISLHLMKNIIERNQISTKKRYTILTMIFAFSFSIAIGTLWETFEFIGDYFFKTTMVKGGLEDTITDLVVKILGAFIASLIYFFNKSKE